MQSHRAPPRGRDFEALGFVLGLFAILFVVSALLGTPGLY
jgi:hypothetical protein